MPEEYGAAVYSIGAVVRMVGVTAQTLRAWEARYGQIVPARSPGGQRIYSRDQVDQLCFIRERLEQGLPPGDAHRLLAERDPDPVDARHAEGRRLTILLAERDPYAADFAEYFLRTEGYSTHAVFDAVEAGRIVEADPPDLVVVDLLISGGAGLALCSTARGGSIPVLAVSALEARNGALSAGADAFLQKPLDPLQLVSTVRDLLGTTAYLHAAVTPP